MNDNNSARNLHPGHQAMGRHGRSHPHNLATFERACAGAVYVVHSHGDDNMFGCPFFCCKGSSVTCNSNSNFLPDELNGIMSLTDYSLMITEINQVLVDTHMPMIPCLFTHFCLPFSPICAQLYCMYQRKTNIQAILQKYNVNLAETGYYWEPAPDFTQYIGVAILKVNHAAHEKYVRTHGSAHHTNVAKAVPVYPSAPMVAVDAVSREY